MKTKIQDINGYSLHVDIQKTPDGQYNHMKILSYYDQARNPDEPQKKLEIFLTDEQFSVLCRSLNIYSLDLT